MRGLTTFMISLMLLAIFISGCSSNNSSAPSSNAQAYTGAVQVVNVKVVGANYVLTPSLLKQNVPAKLVFDMNTVTGCSQSVVISSFGIRKFVSPADNTITFTPTQAGNFGIACSMNMYRGEFSVE